VNYACFRASRAPPLLSQYHKGEATPPPNHLRGVRRGIQISRRGDAGQRAGLLFTSSRQAELSSLTPRAHLLAANGCRRQTDGDNWIQRGEPRVLGTPARWWDGCRSPARVMEYKLMKKLIIDFHLTVVKLRFFNHPRLAGMRSSMCGADA
jgi:hypothetical protein